MYSPSRPLSIATGFIRDDYEYRVMLANNSDTDTTLTDISVSGDSDVVSWDTTPPTIVMKNQAVAVIMAIALEDGEKNFSCTISFTAGCATVALLLTGTRATVLSSDLAYLLFPHDWADGLKESLAWKTDVMIARDRTEQRVQLRTLPRRTWDVSLLVAGAARRRFETWVGMRSTTYMMLPIWRDLITLSEPITSGSSLITISGDSDNYVDDTAVVVWDSWDNYEVKILSGHGDGFLSVEIPFENDWPIGSYLAPARQCLSLSTRTISRFNEDVSTYALSLMASSDAWSPTGTAAETYEGIDVCPFTPSWDDPSEEIDNKWIRLDNDTGIIEFDVQSVEPCLTRDINFVIIGRDNIDTWLMFLSDRAGRLAPFWLAANDRGFELAESASAEQSYIVIEPIDYASDLDGSAAREHIELITTDGTVIRRQILSVQSLATGNEQLNLSDTLGTDISAATLNRSAWLECVRLDSDEVELHWQSGECLTTKLSIVVLP